jgi:hypothetical protein
MICEKRAKLAHVFLTKSPPAPSFMTIGGSSSTLSRCGTQGSYRVLALLLTTAKALGLAWIRGEYMLALRDLVVAVKTTRPKGFGRNAVLRQLRP